MDEEIKKEDIAMNNDLSVQKEEVGYSAPLEPKKSIWSRWKIVIATALLILVGAAVTTTILFIKKEPQIPAQELSSSQLKPPTEFVADTNIDKFYYAVIEKGGLVYPVGQGSYNYGLPNLVTIFKYDIEEEKLSKAFGPYPSNANYLEDDYSPRVTFSDSGDELIFSENMMFIFRGGVKEFNIITPHKDLLTENTESPVLSPDGDRIAYAVGSQIKMYDRSSGEYLTLIEDSTKLARGSKNFHGSVAYPVYWIKKGSDERLVIEVRSKNQNHIPLALTDFYVYSFEQDAYSPTNFYYEKGKQIQQCTGYASYCETSPFVRSRSPNGRFEIIESGESGLSIIDFASLSPTHWETENATKQLPSCRGKVTWSYDSRMILCSGLDLAFEETTSDTLIQNLKENKGFDLVYKYTFVDIETNVAVDSKTEQIQVVFPADTRNEFLSQIKELESELLEEGISKDSEEFRAYMNQASWGLFRALQSIAAEKGKKIIGWIGKDTYLAIKTKVEESRNNPISHEVILTDLSGGERILGEYSINPDEQLAGQLLIEKLQSANVAEDRLNKLQDDITNGVEFYATLDEVYIKFLGGVSPKSN